MKTTCWSTIAVVLLCLAGVGVTRDVHGQGRGRGAALTLPDGPGKDAVQAQCTKCHALGLIANSGGFNQQGWDELAQKVAALPITDQAARRFQRLIFAGATEVELDRQGRILLPAFLRSHIDLGTDAVVVGSRDHAEIWVPETWSSYGQSLDDPEELAQAFEGLGI